MRTTSRLRASTTAPLRFLALRGLPGCALLAAVALAPALAACGSDEAEIGPADKFGAGAGTTTVVGDGAGGAAFVTPGAGECLDVKGECVKPADKCGADGRADVIVDSSGKVLEIVCYPAGDTAPTVEQKGDVDLDKQNGGVVAIDGAADGVDVEGNVSSKGNNVTVYGAGPDVSVIGGNVDADGNNFSARGVTVKGNVVIDANNGTIVLSVVEGNIEYTGNNFVLAETTVLGNVKIIGNNARLVGNRIHGTLEIDGQNTVCDGNVDENGAAIGCN